MAQPLNAYFWADKPLDGEAVHCAADVIVDGSDIDDSPAKKLERCRNREKIGRRYLLGHTPILQSAALRGPFGRGSGWFNPWSQYQQRHSDCQFPLSTWTNKETFRTKTVLEDDESKTLRGDASNRPYVDGPDESERVNDPTWLFNADIKDDASEQSQYSGNYGFEQGRFIEDRLQFSDSDNDILNTSQEDLERLIDCSNMKVSRRLALESLRDGNKRKPDTTWLKGAHILKRSRHEVLEHSSPTPASFGRANNNRSSPGSSPQSVRPKGLRRRIRSQQPGNTNGEVLGNYRSLETPGDKDGGLKATREAIEAHTNNLVIRDDLSHTAPSPLALIMPASATRRLSNNTPSAVCASETSDVYKTRDLDKSGGLILTCEEIQYDVLGVDDILGLSEAARLALAGANLPAKPPILQKWRLVDVELSPSNSDVDQELSREGSISTVSSLSAEDSVGTSHVSVLGNEMPNGVDVGTNFDDSRAYQRSPSPTSEGSFRYRRTKRKSKRKKDNGNLRDVPIHNEGEMIASTEDIPVKPSENISEAQRTPQSISNRETQGTSSIESESPTKKKGDNKNLRRSPRINSAVADEKINPSSPDPLFEELLEDSDAKHAASGNNRASETLAAQELCTDGKRLAEGLLEETLQYFSDSEPQIDNEQQSMSHVVSDVDYWPQSIDGLVQDYLEQSKSLKFSMQYPLSGTGIERSSPEPQPEEIDNLIENLDFSDDGNVSPRPEVRTGLEPLNQPRYNLRSPGSVTKYRKELESTPKSPQPIERTEKSHHSSERKPEANNSSDLQQSPWMTVGVEALRQTFSLEFGLDGSHHDKAHKGIELQEENMPTDESTLEEVHMVSQGDPIVTETYTAETNLTNSGPSVGYTSALSDGTAQPLPPFPSTQILVEAATANPWNSAFKKPRSRKSDKRVSFGPLPSDDVYSSPVDPPLKAPESLESPPTLVRGPRLTHLDDQFLHELRATRKLEVTKESRAMSMNAQWNATPSKLRAKLPPHSPAIDAMAEAFIAADRQTLRRGGGTKGSLKIGGLITKSPDTEDASTEPWTSTALERQRAGSSSSIDTSFSIAPNGKVTVVNVDIGPINGEDNFDAMIDDMGSLFQGWDVDVELKKAKGNRFEKRGDFKGRGGRGYLSGLPNR